MLELYYFHGATCGLKTRFTMAEKGAEFFHHVLQRPELKTPEYLKLNPNGVVPTLVHDDAVLVESSVIMRYIDDVAEGPPLRPDAPLDHARANLWMKKADEYYLPALGTLTYTVGHRPELLEQIGDDLEGYLASLPNLAARERRRKVATEGFDSPDFAAAVITLDTMLTDMEMALNNTPHLAGERYSLADAAITPFLERLNELAAHDLWEDGRPAVADWWDRIRGRASYDDVLGAQGHPEAEIFAERGSAAWPRLQSILADR